MDMTEKIAKAKAQLILEQPFFATLALQMDYVADTTRKTAITDGKRVFYNPQYIESLSVEEIKGVLAHEVMHTALLHHTRRNNRDRKKWNRATDYAINPLLFSSGFVLPEGRLYAPEFENLSAEKIYCLLPQESPPDEPDQDESGGTGDVEDLPDDYNVQEQETEMKQVLAQAAMVARRQGKLPAHLERLVEEVLRPKISWQEVLARFLAEITRNDYSWKKPSPRFLSSGLYLPTLESEEAGKLILIVDTSTSISQTLINQFAGEAQDIASTFNIALQIIYVDVKVCAVQDIEPDEAVKLHPKGGGGTDFVPGFEYIEANDLQPKAVVYLTDGECGSFPTVPDYPVLWAQFGDTDFIPPFGEVIQVSENNTPFHHH